MKAYTTKNTHFKTAPIDSCQCGDLEPAVLHADITLNTIGPIASPSSMMLPKQTRYRSQESYMCLFSMVCGSRQEEQVHMAIALVSKQPYILDELFTALTHLPKQATGL